MKHIVLFQPDIPQNCGNIMRTCSVTGYKLALVRPCGFQFTDPRFKRAGLDYQLSQTIDYFDSLEELLEKSDVQPIFFSSKGLTPYHKICYKTTTHLIFGSETRGLPDTIFSKYANQMAYIPMIKSARCLNLANAVAVALYESLRQDNFTFSNIDP